MVVDHDEVCDRVEDFHPVPIGLLDACEQTGVLKRHRSVASHGFEEDTIFLIERRRRAGQTEQSG